MGEGARSHRIALIKPRCRNSTTACRIKSFIPIENRNIEKLGATKNNPNMFDQVSLK